MTSSARRNHPRRTTVVAAGAAVFLIASLAGTAPAQEGAEPPASTGERAAVTSEQVDSALVRMQQARLEAIETAMDAVASGDAVRGYLAVQRAIELVGDDPQLLRARDQLQDAAVAAARERAQRLLAEGNSAEAMELLAPLAAATDDREVSTLLARATRAAGETARQASTAPSSKPDEAAPPPPARLGAPSNTFQLANRIDAVEYRVSRVEALLERIDTRLRDIDAGQRLDGRAELAVQELDRRLRDLERQALTGGGASSSIRALEREVQQLRWEVRDLRRIRR